MQETDYQRGTDPATNATFGPGLIFEGKLTFQGQVRFDGTFTGEITTDGLLIIGETAKVSADITCGSVVVNGEVNGKIKARDSVELRGRARVKADLVTASLVMDKGVVFDGYCNMEPTVAAFAPKAARQKAWQARGKAHANADRGSEEQARHADFSAD
jgi:cytoskeletal protein CcmA (bactofilin family)